MVKDVMVVLSFALAVVALLVGAVVMQGIEWWIAVRSVTETLAGLLALVGGVFWVCDMLLSSPASRRTSHRRRAVRQERADRLQRAHTKGKNDARVDTSFHGNAYTTIGEQLAYKAGYRSGLSSR